MAKDGLGLSSEEEEENAIRMTESGETTNAMQISPPERVSHQPGQPGRRNTPSPMMKGLSTALMQGAFEKFGQAFTDTGDVKRDAASAGQRLAPFRDAGAVVAKRLEDRWFRMEYENFQAEEVEPFIAAKKQMMMDYKDLNSQLDQGLYPGPDGATQEFDINTIDGQRDLLRLRTSLFQKFYQNNSDMDMSLANEAFKYPANPIIDERIQAIVTAGQKGLQAMVAPKEQLESEAIQHGMSMDMRRAEAAERTAAAQEKAVKQADRPISVKEALADPKIGIESILPWAEDAMMDSAQAGAYIAQGKAVLTDQLHKAHKAEFVAGGGKEADYDILDPENIAWVESQLAQSGGAIQRAATVEFVRAKDPKAAEAAKRHSPQYFELMGDTKPDGPKGIISDKRITEEQRDANVKGWKQPLADKLNEYMADPNNDPDIETAIAHIVDEWLPGAITGSTKSTAPPGIQATQSENTAKYRELVTRFARRYLEGSFWRISKVAAQRNKKAAHRSKQSQGRKSGGLARANKSLFGDE